MRLRLTVQRNGLPAANILWNVPDTNSSQAYTITRLLEDVNHVIPLEAEQWGLEHYVVEVGGFECLHFSPVAQALKDDDHVSIRPLMTAEERARTLTGRHQISDDGRHLVDGIPFGRPYLRNPRRPAVRIPPRKRQRLSETDKAEQSAESLAEVLGSLSSEQIALLTNGDADSGAERPDSEERASKRVRFKGPEIDGDDDDDDSDADDDDFDPAGPPDGQAALDGEEDESEDDSDFDSDTDSAPTSSSGSSSSGSDSEDTSSDSDSGSDASSPPEVQSSKAIPTVPKQNLPVSPVHVAPGHGRPVTHSRNSRRTRTNRLRYLKEAGKLPPDANLKALDEYESANAPGLPSHGGPAKPFSSHEGKRKRIDDDDTENVTQTGTELEERKQELMATLDEDLDSIMAEVEKPIALSTAPQNSIPTPEVREEQPPAKVETPKKRLRPDTSAIGRILAASIPSKRKQKAKPEVEKAPEPEGASDPDFWKTRINLSAFECWEEEFELSAPPYPFKQHWDPASKLMREKVEKKKQKGRRKRESMPVEVEEEEEEEEAKIFLDYDDTGATEEPDAEISAAIEDQLRQDVATAAQSDLPPLPEDIDTLPALASEDIKAGAVIVFKFFTVNPVTITPEISDYKTAIVDREGDSGHGAGTIRLKIAQRDLPKREKKFDKKGNRVYEAADQFYMDDEEEDGSIWEGQFGEMLEAKLLKAA